MLLSTILSYVRILLGQATNNVIIFNKARNSQQLNDILFCTESGHHTTRISVAANNFIQELTLQLCHVLHVTF